MGTREESIPAKPESSAQLLQDCPGFKTILGTSSVSGKLGQLVTVIGGVSHTAKLVNGGEDEVGVNHKGGYEREQR